MRKLTREQAAIVGAYTGFTAGPFGDLHRYAERKLGRPIFTHEFAVQALSDELRTACREDYLSICAGGTPVPDSDPEGNDV